MHPLSCQASYINTMQYLYNLPERMYFITPWVIWVKYLQNGCFYYSSLQLSWTTYFIVSHNHNNYSSIAIQVYLLMISSNINIVLGDHPVIPHRLQEDIHCQTAHCNPGIRSMNMMFNTPCLCNTTYRQTQETRGWYRYLERYNCIQMFCMRSMIGIQYYYRLNETSERSSDHVIIQNHLHSLSHYNNWL